MHLVSQDLYLYNKVDFEAIPDVVVHAPKYEYFEITDVNGKVILPPMELYDTIYFQHPSFADEMITIEELLMKHDFKYFLTQKTVLIDEVVISASKLREKVSDIPNKVKVIHAEEISFKNPQTSADILRQSGEVFVQKSQGGGGSPVLRGFEANKVLLVVDGLRMNNAIYRNGHLQNVNSIDPATLDRAEVVFGPGSVIYGSDALGGVMNFVTRKPMISGDSNQVKRIRAFYRYSSVNNEQTGHFSLNTGREKFGSYTGISYSSFDDLKVGRKRTHPNKDWGKLTHYVVNDGGRDTTLVNEKDHVLKNSGFNQFFLTQKFRYVPTAHAEVGLNLQYTSSSDIPRFENLNDFELVDSAKNQYESAKYSEWYYGPMTRVLAALTFDLKDKKAFDLFSLSGAYQYIEESRHSRRYKSTSSGHNIEVVNVFLLNADFNKKLGKNLLQFGFEASYNGVNSEAYSYDSETLEYSTAGEVTRYPDEGSHVEQYSLYITNKLRPIDQLTLNAGLRFTEVVLNSKFGEQSLNGIPPIYKNKKGALSGALGLSYNPGSGVEFKSLLSSGFRMPNVDDYGKIRLQDGEVTIPNLDLKPEYIINSEFTVLKNFEEVAQLKATIFYTHLFNAINRIYSNFNGEDSIVIDSELARVITNDNIDKAQIFGFSFGLHSDIGKFLSMESTIKFTKGKDLTADGPLAHIPPIFGMVSMTYHIKRFQTELFVEFNGQKTLDDYSNSSSDRLDEALVIGTPSWYTLNLRTTAQLHEYVSLQFDIENILDHHYKPFSSGISAPGRNFIVTLRTKF